MKLIVGLGNPGEQYAKTRHNVGFMFLDELVRHPDLGAVTGISFGKSEKFDADMAEVQVKGQKVILAKPQTYMNLSGESVSKIVSYYKLDVSDIIVVSDDVDLPLGKVRIRCGGSSGGHKGLSNIIDRLGSDQFDRIRIGIANHQGVIGEAEKQESRIDTAAYVLQRFDDREMPVVKRVIGETVSYIVPCLSEKECELPSHTLTVL
ncbi:MAG: Peptidyl-tRNA hydrolase [bacterium ADurb.Bin400]|nr:MAG: Peptidyl-tRNA hydrolase [bacterium ADurb.Bin400]